MADLARDMDEIGVADSLFYQFFSNFGQMGGGLLAGLTSPEAIQYTIDLLTKVGKKALHVKKDVPGFAGWLIGYAATLAAAAGLVYFLRE